MQVDTHLEIPPEFAQFFAEETAAAEQPTVLHSADLVSQRLPLHRQVDPSPDTVDGEKLLDDIFASIRRYVVADDDTLRAAALWSVHTWLMDVWTVSPIANITAPGMRSGKTLLLQVLEELVCRPLPTSNITPAAMFRMAHVFQPTLLIDEVDSFLRGNDDARGMLNSGLYKKGAFVMRCVGEFEPKPFSVWCPKALCGIGSLASTLADRSIVLRLRRKLPTEVTENLRRSDDTHWSSLRSRIARWAADHRDALSTHVPVAISSINDRANDCWEPLLSIAEIAGSKWNAYARSAAETLQEGEHDVPGMGLQLLQDVRGVLTPSNPKIFSSRLLRCLISEHRCWTRFNKGEPLLPQQMAEMLRQFGIRAKPMRIGDRAGPSGYEWSACEDAFARYLQPDPYEISIVPEAA